MNGDGLGLKPDDAPDFEEPDYSQASDFSEPTDEFHDDLGAKGSQTDNSGRPLRAWK